MLVSGSIARHVSLRFPVPGGAGLYTVKACEPCFPRSLGFFRLGEELNAEKQARDLFVVCTAKICWRLACRDVAGDAEIYPRAAR